METPATQGATVMIFVPVSFKAFIHMQYIPETCFQQNLTGLTRSLATAADQDNW
jgi:hypothetical protein